MIACRSCSPALDTSTRRTSEPAGARSGGPVFLTPRRPSAFARRLVPELAGAASTVETPIETPSIETPPIEAPLVDREPVAV